MFIIQCALYNVNNTMYTVRSAMYNAQCSYLYTNETTDYDKDTFAFEDLS